MCCLYLLIKDYFWRVALQTLARIHQHSFLILLFLFSLLQQKGLTIRAECCAPWPWDAPFSFNDISVHGALKCRSGRASTWQELPGCFLQHIPSQPHSLFPFAPNLAAKEAFTHPITKAGVILLNFVVTVDLPHPGFLRPVYWNRYFPECYF